MGGPTYTRNSPTGAESAGCIHRKFVTAWTVAGVRRANAENALGNQPRMRSLGVRIGGLPSFDSSEDRRCG